MKDPNGCCMPEESIRKKGFLNWYRHGQNYLSPCKRNESSVNWPVAREEQGGAGLAYKEEVRKSGGENVEILEPVFEEEVLIKEYQQARVFAYPSQASTGETFGLAVLEAMSCGCVPVVSSLECFRDFIENGKNGYQMEVRREEDTLHSLAESMQRILGETKLEELSESAIKTAAHYQIDQVALQFLHDFEELLRG